MRASMVVTVLLATSCVSEPVEIDDPGHDNVFDVPEEEEQGRHILGSYADGLLASGYHVAVPNIATLPGGGSVTVGVSGARLTGVPDAQLIGLRFLPSGGGILEIVGSDPVQRGVKRYQLVHHTATGPHAYCANSGRAVPVLGRYTASRLHVAGTQITFVCPDSVPSKCINWGYFPGEPGSSNWDYHQTCTRMANADYCGEGVSYTREKTPIVIRDRDYAGAKPDFVVEPLTRAPNWFVPPENFYYESAWAPTGAVCMSKARWASLPPGGPCNAKLPDPRLPENATRPKAKTCEDLFAGNPAGSADVLMYNASLTNDMRLTLWQDPMTGDHLTTVRGYASGTAPGISPIPYLNYSGLMLDQGILLRNPPATVVELIHPVYMYRSGTNRVVARPGMLPGYAIDGANSFEGYVFDRPPTGNFLALRLYTRGGDAVSATSPPPGAGWSAAAASPLIGYVMAQPPGF